jgi:hypothetical protein
MGVWVEAAGMGVGVEAAGMGVVAVDLLRFTVGAAEVVAGMAEAVDTMDLPAFAAEAVRFMGLPMVAWPTLVMGGVAMH